MALSPDLFRASPWQDVSHLANRTTLPILGALNHRRSPAARRLLDLAAARAFRVSLRIPA